MQLIHKVRKGNLQIHPILTSGCDGELTANLKKFSTRVMPKIVEISGGMDLCGKAL